MTPDPWEGVRRWTEARLALGRAGSAIPTGAVLDFQLCHARARDAVVRPCGLAGLAGAIGALGQGTVQVRSRAPDRAVFLRRPDLGRLLHPDDEERLAGMRGDFDLALMVGDGLSASAVEQQALPFLWSFLPLASSQGWKLAPLVLASQARVALSDEVGSRLGARAIAVLIGERPGLSSPDSLGIYLTWQPRPGLQNANRNCLSNIRPGGMGFDEAARRLADLMKGACRLGTSGVGLKEDSWRTLAD
jgi:ethanolamine ammonia-lyase small subunit